jgi:hypothetical protein
MASGMKTTPIILLLGLALAVIVGYLFGRSRGKVVEKFQSGGCNRCGKPNPCGCRPAKSGNVADMLNMPPPPRWPTEAETKNLCGECNKPKPCGCGPVLKTACPERCAPCPACPVPDLSKWMKKSAVPPCPPLPDMTKYMLKTECPPLPDMSKYVLKSAVPKCPPCISTCSKPCKIGECPPCPRPRCPVVKCPDPKACPACPAAQCAPCPEPNIQCKANYMPSTPVRPMLASTAAFNL